MEDLNKKIDFKTISLFDRIKLINQILCLKITIEQTIRYNINSVTTL